MPSTDHPCGSSLSFPDQPGLNQLQTLTVTDLNHLLIWTRLSSPSCSSFSPVENCRIFSVPRWHLQYIQENLKIRRLSAETRVPSLLSASARATRWHALFKLVSSIPEITAFGWPCLHDTNTAVDLERQERRLRPATPLPMASLV